MCYIIQGNSAKSAERNVTFRKIDIGENVGDTIFRNFQKAND